MRFNVIGIGDYIGKCIYDEAEDSLMVDEEVVLDFKKEYKEYLRYTKFMIHNKDARHWISFQFIPNDYTILKTKFAIITAHNPKGMIYNSFTNFIRNCELESVIKTLGYEYYLSIGTLFWYNEESFIIYEIEKDEAINLAKIFEQHSIFYNSGEDISIIECDSKKELLKYNYKKHFKELN